MKTAAIRRLRQRLAQDAAVFGLWVTLESPSITEMAVALGLDWVVIDAEHGHLDWKEILEHIRATVRSDTVALVRIAELNISLIKRALDIGADGIIIPWIETAEQLRQAVSFARYPLEGLRGIGGERATGWGQCLVEHAADANEHVMVVPIIETVRAAEALPEMCQVEGVELFQFGPADFSSTAGYRGQWEGPGVAERLLELKDVIRRAGKNCGVLAKSIENIHERRAQGFRFIGLGMDMGLLGRALRTSLAAVARDHGMQASFEPVAPPTATPLARPPEAMRPDRPEVMNDVGSGPRFEVAPNVFFDGLVGGHNNARKLTTGLVTVAPNASLPYHTHTFGESVTVLRGSAQAEIEGRRYQISELDNVTIPVGVAHTFRNTSTSDPVVFHIALATDTPSRDWVDPNFPIREMPADSQGQPGAERVTRYKLAARGSAGPNTEFIDYFNSDLMPNIEMSGGYGLFYPRGRLPAHVHDFDESISIIRGTATCVVEGRRYSMQNCATALQPRGRVHYFINESPDVMEMIWVYAGPQPDRIIVEEACATAEGNPWK